MSERTPFRVRAYRAGDADGLLTVEHAAGALLDAVAPHDPVPPIGRDAFATFLEAHTVRVATIEGSPVGYAAGLDLTEIYWLRELAVDPRFGRRGIGRALLASLCEEARARFHRAIGLTTYRDVAFNAPFYARCGFLTVSPEDAAATVLGERLVAERPAGADAADRVAMVKWL